MRPIEFVYLNNGTALKRVDEIKDLGVFMDGKMSVLPQIESIISKSSRMLGFINSVFQEIFVTRAFGLLTSRFILSGLSECNTISFVM
jgi:hypothetical protein